MTNAEKTQNQQENSTDIIAKIKTSRDDARSKVKDNLNPATKSERYESLRAATAVVTYDEVLSMIEWGGTGHRIPAMATEALADFERAISKSYTTGVCRAYKGGRSDALTAVAGWMNAEDNS